jgi:orotidine-5'-phosphate decarboxylase
MPLPPSPELALSASQTVAIPQPVSSRERLIVALDVPTADEALALVGRLGDCCQWYKVGLELYLAAGNTIVEMLIGRGHSVFLDLKLHDIPNTVAGAVGSVGRLGAGLLTVHASGGPTMLRAAVEAAQAQPYPPELLAVTVLTSMDAQQLNAVGVEADPADQVLKLARLGLDCGIRGFVCSPQEVAAMRSALGPEAVLVTPGIRPAGADSGDQKRWATPAAAICDGASYLVVGRPITQAADPFAAAKAILAEIESALL